jgi:adenylate cyclase, class 2
VEYTEVERKYSIADGDLLRTRLKEAGATPGGHARQIDTYYNAPHRDFLAADVVSEWLRIREEDGVSSLNLKRWLPLGAAEQTHCDEFETTVADGQAVRHLLAALDFPHLVTVDKTRETWTLNNTVEVAIDTVADLGTFVEFEYAGPATNLEDALLDLTHAIDALDLDLGERDRRGYPYLLLDRQR